MIVVIIISKRILLTRHALECSLNVISFVGMASFSFFSMLESNPIVIFF